MKKLEFKKYSWHYWFINKTTSYFERMDRYELTPDICSYTRAFLAGVLKVVLVGTAAAFVLSLILSAIVWWVSLLFKFKVWFIISSTLGPVGTFFMCLATLIIAVIFSVGLIQELNERRKKNNSDKSPTAIQQMYRAWKDKTCSQIEFK